MIPVLFITYNRLEYTKRSLNALLKSNVQVIIIDNNSTDGTKEWLQQFTGVVYNSENTGIAGAMNQFMKMIGNNEYAGKVDNDTIVQPDWADKLVEKVVKYSIDIIQAKHEIAPAVANGKTFDQWVATMPVDSRDRTIRYHHFVGGSGIVFRTSIIKYIPDHAWKLYGWRQYQREHPELKTAFCTDVEAQLLDGGGRYQDYPEYYKETKRL